MIDRYIMDVDSDMGEEHITIFKTDGTSNMSNWKTLVIIMYSHHSFFEPLVEELNKLAIENKAQSDTIDGLQELLAHVDLEELMDDI